MLAYVHPSCGKPAFMLNARPAFGGKEQSKDVLHLNYQPMEYAADKVCESCGAAIHGLSSANVRVMI